MAGGEGHIKRFKTASDIKCVTEKLLSRIALSCGISYTYVNIVCEQIEHNRTHLEHLIVKHLGLTSA